MRRAEIRLSKPINRRIYLDLCKAISTQKKVGICEAIQHLEKCSRIRSKWLVRIGDVYCVVIWDRKRHAVCTFLKEVNDGI